SPKEFLTLIAREGVSILNQTPSTFHQLLQAQREDSNLGQALGLRHVIFGGEALDLRRLQHWYEHCLDGSPALVNMYGITETTVHVTHLVLDQQLAITRVGASSGVALPICACTFWIVVWSLCLLGLLGSFTFLGRALRGASWVVGH